MHLLRMVPVALLLAAQPVLAAKLDKPVCDDLKVEQGLLQQKGIPTDLARGPEWGKANLSRDRLKEIERLIHVEEQLAFRCPQPRKPLAPGEDEDGAVVTAKGAKASTKTAAAPKAAKAATADPSAPPPKKKAVKPQAPQSAASTPAAAAAAEPARKPASKPKTKVDDAYTPPAGANSGSPFKN